MQSDPDFRDMPRLESKSSVSTLLVEDDWLIRVNYHRAAVLTVAAAKEEIELVTVLMDRKRADEGADWPVRILVDARSIRKASREAKALFGSDEFSEMMHITGVAVMVKSSVSKMLANSFLAWSRPPHPTRLFTCEEEAKHWLKGLPSRDDAEKG